MLRPQGYGVWVEPGVSTREQDSFTCGHCNAIVFVSPLTPTRRVSDDGFCRLCSSHVCPTCTDKGDCTPFMRLVERAELEN